MKWLVVESYENDYRSIFRSILSTKITTDFITWDYFTYSCICDYDVLCVSGRINADHCNIISNIESKIFKLAFNVSFDDLSLISKLTMFDHVYITDRTYLIDLQKSLGTFRSHYLPDILLLSDTDLSCEIPIFDSYVSNSITFYVKWANSNGQFPYPLAFDFGTQINYIRKSIKFLTIITCPPMLWIAQDLNLPYVNMYNSKNQVSLDSRQLVQAHNLCDSIDFTRIILGVTQKHLSNQWIILAEQRINVATRPHLLNDIVFEAKKSDSTDLAKEKLRFMITGFPDYSSCYLKGIEPLNSLREYAEALYSEQKNIVKKKPINTSMFSQHMLDGVHRSGWEYVVSSLESYSSFNGVYLDTFIDRSFLWCNKLFVSQGILPYTTPWIGIVHHPPNTEYSENNTVNLLNSAEFQQSLTTCHGLITLSNYLRDWIFSHLSQFQLNRVPPIIVLKHPTEFPSLKFTYEKFQRNSNKKVVQIGAWLRNPFSIYELKTPPMMIKCALKGHNMDSYFPPNESNNGDIKMACRADRNKWIWGCAEYLRRTGVVTNDEQLELVFSCLFDDNISIIYPTWVYETVDSLKRMISEVRVLKTLSNSEYDVLLSENIVCINLIDASAVNTIIECIVRSTPIFINRHPAVVEYLGENYPLYYDKIGKLNITFDLVRKGYEYLRFLDKSEYRIDTFIRKLTSLSVL